MTEHPNAVLWREAQEAFSRRDMDAVGRFLVDAVVSFLGSAFLAATTRA